MTTRVVTLMALGALLLPVQAVAQSAADRVRTVVRERIVTPPAVRYQRGRDGQEQTDRTTRTLKIGTTGELAVTNIAGDIVVTRTDGSEARVDIVKTSRAQSVEEARENLRLVEVDVVERAGRAEITTRYPEHTRNRSNRRMNVSVAYTIAAPAGTRVTVRSISGDVRVTDIKGDLQIDTISGDVRVVNAGRVSGAKSVSGSVEILDTDAEGTLEANSISGTVAVRRIKARRIALGSISGDVVIENVECDRAEAQSMSGDVTFSGPLATGGRYQLNSHSGNVRAAVAGSTGFEVEANSWSGNVRADDLAIRLRSGGDGRRTAGLRRTLRGVVGDGSAVLSITTFSGSVVITRR
jgi:DUF4097 and DUF4098 domain-containing protein YvlB